MTTTDLKNLIDKLDQNDRAKIAYFIKLLITQEKYRKIQEEITQRRKEILNGETLSHEEVWKELDV